MEGSSVHSDPEGSELSQGLLNYQQAQLEQQNLQDEATEESKKAVSFMTSASNEQLQVEDQTPLIFSRSSSFESLNSFVQQPFQGSEYSSYQCSRVTSGRVSPSDLPDSPIQSRPYTPKVKILKNHTIFAVKRQKLLQYKLQKPIINNGSINKSNSWTERFVILSRLQTLVGYLTVKALIMVCWRCVWFFRGFIRFYRGLSGFIGVGLFRII